MRQFRPVPTRDAWTGLEGLEKRVLLSASLDGLDDGGVQAAAVQVPFTFGGDGVNPDDFRVTVFASGLKVPVGMLELEDGSILYGGIANATFPFQTGTFELRRLVDNDGDGMADNGQGDVLYTGPANAGGVNAIAQDGDLIYVVSNNTNKGSNITARIMVLRKGANPGDALTEEASLVLSYSSFVWHTIHGMAVRNVGPGQTEVYFNVGSRNNDASDNDDPTIIAQKPSTSGLITGTNNLDFDSIYRMTVTDGGAGNVTADGLLKIAEGLRNAAGMAFHPVTGDLWFQENGKDASGNDPLNADELNFLAVADLGGDVEDFGFETDYIVYGGPGAPIRLGGPARPGDRIEDATRDAVQPVAVFLEDEGEHAQGASQIAFAPDAFPEPLNNGIFVGFHGFFNAGGTNNPENPLAYFDLDAADTADVTDGTFHITSPGIPGVGHLDGLLSTATSLFIADMSASGVWINNPTPTDGVIYMVTPISALSASVGDRVWMDDDRDGVQDAGEQGVENIPVQLFSAGADGQIGGGDDLLIDNTTTDAGGNYSFTGLDAGDYYVQFTVPQGQSFTQQDRGGDDALDSDVDARGRSAVFALTGGQSRADLDAGIVDLPFIVGGDPSVDLNDFRITEFASGLSAPFGMLELSDGSILVGETLGNFSNPTDAQLSRLNDSNGDGVADGGKQVLASGIPGAITGVRQAGDLIVVVSVKLSNPRVSWLTFFRAGATPDAALTEVGQLQIDYFPDNNEGNVFQHIASTVETRAVPGQAGKFDVFFQIGSETNQDNQPGTPHDAMLSSSDMDLTGIATTLPGERIYMLRLDDTAGTGAPTLENLFAVAVGVRNPAGMVIDPATGDLIFQDNGMDNNAIEGGHEALSADELNILPFGQIDETAEDFGFPNRYVDYRTGQIIGPNGAVIDPFVAFQPIPDPQRGAESEGAAELALSPSAFPDGLNNGVFIGFHGRTPGPGIDPESPVVYVDLDTGEYFHFISAFHTEVGPLDSLLSTATSLFLADSFNSGSIYQVSVDDGDPGDPDPQDTVIGDRVWLDTNGNGVQDGGEPGVANATVNLYNAGGDGQVGGGDDSLVATTTTDADGEYSFVGAAPGSYFVEFIRPGGLVFTTQDAGANDALDSDADVATGRTDAFVLAAEQVKLDVDAGLVVAAAPTDASVGDRVWLDTNGNGIQDGGEVGVEGVTVRLFNAGADGQRDDIGGAQRLMGVDFNGMLYSVNVATGATTVIGNTGLDELIDIAFGPDGYLYAVTTTANASGEPSALYRIDPITGASYLVGPTGLDQMSDGDLDFDPVSGTLYGIGSLDRLFTIDLNTGAATVIGTVVTAGNPDISAMAFRNDGTLYAIDTAADTLLTLNKNTAAVLSTRALSQTLGNIAGMDFNPANGDLVVADGSAGDASGKDRLFRLSPTTGTLVSIGSLGLNDGLSGLEFIPNTNDDRLVGTTTTDANGNYLFDGLLAGAYFVEFDLPQGFAFAPQNAGADDVDSDAEVFSGLTDVFVVMKDQAVLNVDAGLITGATLGDFVWHDANFNGIQDAGEEGISGVQIQLRRSTGELVATAVSDADGFYQFEGVVEGQYFLRVLGVPGSAITLQDVGGNDAVDSDFNRATRETEIFTLDGDEEIGDLDLGLVLLNPEVTLIDLGAPVVDGQVIEGLRRFQLAVDKGDTPGLIDLLRVSISSGAANIHQLWTLVQPGSGDPAVPTATPLADDLPPSLAAQLDTYFLLGDVFSLSPMSGPSENSNNAGGPASDAADSSTLQTGFGNSYLYGGRAADEDLQDSYQFFQIVLPDPLLSDLAINVRVGFKDLASRDVTVTIDANAGPIAEDDQATTPIDTAVEIPILDNDSDPDGGIDTDSVAITTGPDNGSVTVLADGSVRYTPNIGFVGDDTFTYTVLDNFGAVSNTATVTITVEAPGDPAIVGDYVWLDENGNGIQDAGEPGMEGVIVNLFRAGPDGQIGGGDDGLVGSTVTDADGGYLFEDVAPGVHFVQFVLVPGFAFTDQDAGADDAADSDANIVTGRTAVFSVGSGATDLSRDAGMVVSDPVMLVEFDDDNNPLTPNIPLTDNQNTPIDFGEVPFLADGDLFTFVVNNNSPDATRLIISEVRVPDGFEIVQNLPGEIAAGDIAELIVRLDSSTIGTFAGKIELVTNDPDAPVFEIPVTGKTVVADPFGPAEIVMVDMGNPIVMDPNTFTQREVFALQRLHFFVRRGDLPTRVNEVRVQVESQLGEIHQNWLSFDGTQVPTPTLSPVQQAAMLQLDSYMNVDSFDVLVTQPFEGNPGDLSFFSPASFANTDITQAGFASMMEFEGAVLAGGELDEYMVLQLVVPDRLAGQVVVDIQAVAIVNNTPVQSGRTFVLSEALNFNSPPIVFDDNATVVSNTSVDINVLANDSDPDGVIAPGTVQVTSSAALGSTQVLADGRIRYTPNANIFSGQDTFKYIVADTAGAFSQEATVTVNIIAGDPDISLSFGPGQGGIDPDTGAFVINFGTVFQGTSGPVQTITVANTGTGVLNVFDLPVIAPNGFTVLDGLAGSIAPADFDLLTLRLNTDTPGTFSGDIVLESNSPGESPLTIHVTGTVLEGAPEAQVTLAGLVVPDGGPTAINFDADAAPDLDLDDTEINAPNPTREFVITNVGEQPLVITGINLPDGYELVGDGPTVANPWTLGANVSDTFTVRLRTDVAGLFTGVVSIASNANDNKPYVFAVQGRVVDSTVVPEQTVEVIIGDGANKSVTYTDADGTEVDLQAKSGTFKVKFAGDNVAIVAGKKGVSVVGLGLRVTDVEQTSQIAGAQLKAKTKGGDDMTDIESIYANASLDIKAKGVRVTENLMVDGYINKLDLYGATGLIEAWAIDKFKTDGEMAADMNLTGPGMEYLLGKTKFEAITGGTWHIAGGVDKVNVKTVINNLELHADGDVESIKGQSMTGTTVYAGVAPGVMGVPSLAAHFARNAMINKVNIKDFFRDSVLGAREIGKAKLSDVMVDNNDSPFGVGSSLIGKLQAVNVQNGDKLKLSGVDSVGDLVDILGGTSIEDFNLNIVPLIDEV